MAARGHEPYGYAAHTGTHDAYGLPLQRYGAHSPSSTFPPPGHYLEQGRSAHDWNPYHAQAAVHSGWMPGDAAPAMPGTGDAVGATSTASQVAYSSLNGGHGVSLSQYDWQPQSRAYTPYRPVLPPPTTAPGPAHFGYPSYASYPQASHAPPRGYQPHLPPTPVPGPQPPAREQHTAPAYHLPAPTPPLLSLLPSYTDRRDEFPLRNLLSTTNATRDGSAAVSTPSTGGARSPDAPPALVEPVSPRPRGDSGVSVAGTSVEIPAHRSIPLLIPPMGHVSTADIGRARAALLLHDDEPNVAGGNKRDVPDAKGGAGKRRKEPKDLANRKYACNECDQRFARPSALATHVLTHTKEKPFVCCTCNRGFAVMSNLRRHCRVRSHALAPEQESSARPRTNPDSRSSGSSAAAGGAAPDPGPPPLRALAPAPRSVQPSVRFQ
ncbi:hypothetical protein JCM3770_004555 [Rhodotorula araucariae]